MNFGIGSGLSLCTGAGNTRLTDPAEARRASALTTRSITTIGANDVTLGVEHFGAATAPLVLLVRWHDDALLA